MADFGKNLARGINQNADIIMTVSALIGLVSTVALAIRETPRAIDIIDDAHYSLDHLEGALKEHGISYAEYEEAKRDIRRNTTFALAKNYAPALISGITTGACIIGSTAVNRSRNAALSGLLNATNVAFSEYREHVQNSIGEKKETEIYDEIREEHIVQNPPVQNQIFNTGKGETLCYIEILPGDPTSGLYFYSSPEAVHAAINDANAEGISSGYVSMKDLLYFLGLKIPGKGTDLYGWQITSRNDLIDIRESSHVHPSGKPVLDIGFYNHPYQGYANWG